MPKKQKKQFFTRPSTRPHPSLTLSRSTTSTPHGSTEVDENRSVADSLESLRNEEARRSLPRLPPVATVHPSLRNLLDMPETPQPGSRSGLRTAESLSQVRRISGPAAPPSWQLLANRQGCKIANIHPRETLNHISASFVHEQVSLPGAKLPSRGSLLDTVLRTVAEKWDWHVENDHHYLAMIPLHLKEALLSYVSRYASDESLERSGNTLRVLFLDERLFEAENGAHHTLMEDAAEVTRLDLRRALGTWLRTISSLKKEITRPIAIRGSASSSLEVRHDNGGKSVGEPPESWDDADDAPGDSVWQLPLWTHAQGLPSMRFSKLLHLSLALSSTSSSISVASWSSLLSITPHLSILQSLSLGYWPCPTLTPHAAAISAAVRNPVSGTLPRISYGGTDMYTEPESSWQEAAGILRKLSRHLYCLRWLDLTGCGTWFGALSWTDMEMVDNSPDTGSGLPGVGPNWNASWRNVEYVGLRVGWVPRSLEDNEKSSVFSKTSNDDQPSPSSNSSTTMGKSEAITKGRGLIKQDWDVEEERRKYLAKKELEKFDVIQARAREVARYLRLVRERAGGRRIVVDL